MHFTSALPFYSVRISIMQKIAIIRSQDVYYCSTFCTDFAIILYIRGADPDPGISVGYRSVKKNSRSPTFRALIQNRGH